MAGACLLLAACARGPEPPAGGGAQPIAKAAAPLPPEMQKIQDELDKKGDQTKLEMAQSERDRAELVTPAPAGFKPVVQGRMVELKLIPQKAMLRKGERFWYRAEIRNVGSDAVSITDPFVKSGGLGDPRSKFELVVSPRHWREHATLGGGGSYCEGDPPIPGWGRLDAAQRREALDRWETQQAIKRSVLIHLKPGETLRTQDWRTVSSEEACASKVPHTTLSRPGGLFREHAEARDFDEPGTYSLKLVLSDPPRPLSAEAKSDLQRDGVPDAEISRYERRTMSRHLGNAESEVVRVEVLP